MWIAINGSGFRSHVMIDERLAEPGQIARSLVNTIAGIDQSMSYGIHDCKHPVTMLEIGAIEDCVGALESVSIGFVLWWPVKPVLNDSFDRSFAMTALRCQLPHGVSFGDPALEPNELSLMFIVSR